MSVFLNPPNVILKKPILSYDLTKIVILIMDFNTAVKKLVYFLKMYQKEQLYCALRLGSPWTKFNKTLLK